MFKNIYKTQIVLRLNRLHRSPKGILTLATRQPSQEKARSLKHEDKVFQCNKLKIQQDKKNGFEKNVNLKLDLINTNFTSRFQ